MVAVHRTEDAIEVIGIMEQVEPQQASEHKSPRALFTPVGRHLGHVWKAADWFISWFICSIKSLRLSLHWQSRTVNVDLHLIL